MTPYFLNIPCAECYESVFQDKDHLQATPTSRECMRPWSEGLKKPRQPFYPTGMPTCLLWRIINWERDVSFYCSLNERKNLFIVFRSYSSSSKCRNQVSETRVLPLLGPELVVAFMEALPSVSSNQICPDVAESLETAFNGNDIFNKDYHCSPPPSAPLAGGVNHEQDSTISRECHPQPDAYQVFRDYQERIRNTHCKSPELTRRYFSDLEELSMQIPRSEEFSFTGHLSKPTSQLDRMDMNVATGKNSLFITNGEDEASDVTDIMYDNAVRTDSRAKLLLPFTKETFLGEGRHSKVYKGTIWTRGSTGWCDVAVKLAFKEPESAESLTHELKILKCVRCPYIIDVIDTLQLKGKGSNVFEYGYVMSLADFGTLESFLLANDVFSLSLTQFVSWSKQILLAVKALRDSQITHFDIKPHNILVMRDYSLRLADFGEAICELRPDFEETRGRGTLHYNAPELLSLESNGPCDGAAVDLYSAGLVLYSLMTGRLPWRDIRGPRTHQILTCRRGFSTGAYNPLPPVDTLDEFKLPGPNGEILPIHVVQSLVDLINRCTAFKPHDRYTVDGALAHLNSIPIL